MKKIFSLLSSLCLCLALCTCSKDKDPTPMEQLPPITNTGANTFGCLVNGNPVVFKSLEEISGGLIFDSDSLGWLPFDSSDLWLSFKNKDHSVDIYLNNPLTKSQWNFSSNTPVFPIVTHPENYIIVDGFISSVNTKGVFISEEFKLKQPLFSGTFEFECINPRTCDSIKITNGRLDVNVNELH